jgi:hypothetical protein
VTDDCFYESLGLRKEGILGDNIFVEVGFDGFEARHAFGDDSGSVSFVTELKVAFQYVFSCFRRCQDY